MQYSTMSTVSRMSNRDGQTFEAEETRFEALLVTLVSARDTCQMYQYTHPRLAQN